MGEDYTQISESFMEWSWHFFLTDGKAGGRNECKGCEKGSKKMIHTFLTYYFIIWNVIIWKIIFKNKIIVKSLWSRKGASFSPCFQFFWMLSYGEFLSIYSKEWKVFWLFLAYLFNCSKPSSFLFLTSWCNSWSLSRMIAPIYESH